MAKLSAKEKAAFYYGKWSATGQKKYLNLYYKWRNSANRQTPYKRPPYRKTYSYWS